jgi:type IV pilus assembly protein PilM
MNLAHNFFKYFPAPKFISMPRVGIEITNSSIRYLEINKKLGGSKLGRYGTQDIPGGVLLQEGFSTNKDLQDSLKKIQRANKFQFAEVSIPEENAYLFTTEIPLDSEESIRNHIEFHLEENVPVNVNDAVFDYYIISKDEKTGKGFASVSVVPRQIIDEYIDLFDICGMTPISFLIENQALSRAIIPEDDKTIFLVVNIGYKKTVLSIVRDGAVQFTSTVSIGGYDFDNAIAKEFNVPVEQAEIVKKQKGYIKNADNNQFFMALINSVSALRDEIQRVYMYWQSYVGKSFGKQAGATDEEKKIKIILAGKNSAIIGFKEYMSISLKVPVELANVWSNVFSFEKEIPPIEYMESLDYAVVVGLALPKSTD